MLCKQCGAQNRDGAAFCSACGATLESETPTPQAAQTPTAVQAAQVPSVAQPIVQAAVPGPATPQTPNSDDSKKRHIIIASVLAVVIIVAIIAIAMSLNKQRHVQEQAQLAPQPITISIVADGYTDACTKIPVNVSGTDSKGSPIDTTVFIDSLGEGASLAPGQYTLSFPASPLTPDGILYIPPTNTTTVVINEGTQQNEATSAFKENPASFTKSNALDETDEMINNAYEYAIKDESQTDKAAELKQVAINAHAQAVNAENERKQREAARLIDMPLYTVQIPEYWVGKVDVVKNGNDVTVTAKGSPKAVIIWVGLGSNEYGPDMGDIGGGVCKYVNVSANQYAEMTASFWPYTAAIRVSTKSTSKLEITDAELNTCIELQTGGALNYEKIRAGAQGKQPADQGKYSRQALDYINDNVILTAKNGGSVIKNG